MLANTLIPTHQEVKSLGETFSEIPFSLDDVASSSTPDALCEFRTKPAKSPVNKALPRQLLLFKIDRNGVAIPGEEVGCHFNPQIEIPVFPGIVRYYQLKLRERVIRLWDVARAIAQRRDGSGHVSVRELCLVFGLSEDRILRLCREGDGVLWAWIPSRKVIHLASPKTVADRLEIQSIGQQAFVMPLEMISRSLGDARRAYQQITGPCRADGRPISRAAMAFATGRCKETITNRLHGLQKTWNNVDLGRATPENSLKQRQLYPFLYEWNGRLLRQIGNTYHYDRKALRKCKRRYSRDKQKSRLNPPSSQQYAKTDESGRKGRPKVYFDTERAARTALRNSLRESARRDAVSYVGCEAKRWTIGPGHNFTLWGEYTPTNYRQTDDPDKWGKIHASKSGVEQVPLKVAENGEQAKPVKNLVSKGLKIVPAQVRRAKRIKAELLESKLKKTESTSKPSTSRNPESKPESTHIFNTNSTEYKSKHGKPKLNQRKKNTKPKPEFSSESKTESKRITRIGKDFEELFVHVPSRDVDITHLFSHGYHMTLQGFIPIS